MNLKNRWSVATVAVAAGAFLLLGVGCGDVYRRPTAPADTQPQAEDEFKVEAEGEVEVEAEGAAEESEAAKEKDEAESAAGEEEKSEPVLEESGTAALTFSGTVLAGTTSPLIDYNKADYDKAVASNKLVVLYFYASWCPICRVEIPKLYAAFNQLSGSDVVGFRVNYNDSDTDANEEALAREFGVPYQHTKVFVKNRVRVLKSPETWDTARYLREIAAYD